MASSEEVAELRQQLQQLAAETRQQFQLAATRVEALETKVENIHSKADRGGPKLVDPKKMLPEKYTHGGTVGFASWRDEVQTYCETIRPGMREVLKNLRSDKDPVDQDLFVGAQRVEWCHGQELYDFLLLRTTGEAQRIVKIVQDNNGWEAWRLMHESYEPRSACSKAVLRSEIAAMVQHKAKKPHDLKDLLSRLEEKIKKWEEYAGKKFDPEEAKGYLMTMLDDETRKYMVKFSSDEVSYIEYKAKLNEYILLSSNKMDIDRISPQAQPEMDHDNHQEEHFHEGLGIDAMGWKGSKGKGKGKGKAEDRECYQCGKKGHIKANCPEGPGKGAQGFHQPGKGWGKDSWGKNSWSQPWGKAAGKGWNPGKGWGKPNQHEKGWGKGVSSVDEYGYQGYGAPSGEMWPAIGSCTQPQPWDEPAWGGPNTGPQVIALSTITEKFSRVTVQGTEPEAPDQNPDKEDGFVKVFNKKAKKAAKAAPAAASSPATSTAASNLTTSTATSGSTTSTAASGSTTSTATPRLSIGLLGQAPVKPSIDGCATEQVGPWEKITLTMDSGAAETVIPTNMCPYVPTKPSDGSRKGVEYEVASGHTIPNTGEKTLNVVTTEGQRRSLTMQVCEVNKALVSISKTCRAGHRVVFDDDGSYVQNKVTGEKTFMQHANNTYTLDVWVKKGQPQQQPGFTRPGT